MLVLSCRGAVVPPDLSYVAGIIRRHRRKIGSCWRKLNPGRQALLVLTHLRKGETLAGLAAGFGVGTATAWRYVTGTVRLLAARAPGWARRCAPRGRPATLSSGASSASSLVRFCRRSMSS
jgi:hypothetical protein